MASTNNPHDVYEISKREWILLFLLAASLAFGLFLGGCATVPLRGGGERAVASSLPTTHVQPHTATSRPVCFSRPEVARILTHQARCRADRARAQVHIQRLMIDAKVERNACKARAEAEIKACENTLANAAARRCPACVLPWVLVGGGVVVAIVLGAGWVWSEVRPR